MREHVSLKVSFVINTSRLTCLCPVYDVTDVSDLTFELVECVRSPLNDYFLVMYQQILYNTQ